MCGCTDKISGMRKKRKTYRRRKKAVNTDTIVTAGWGGLGFIGAMAVGSLLGNRISDDAMTNSYAKAAVKIVGGTVLAAQKGKETTAAGIGMATAGVIDIANATGITNAITSAVTPASTAGLPSGRVMRLRGSKAAHVACPPTRQQAWSGIVDV